jgi:LPXTG-site transpeptidase (sortase) family protein
MSCRTRRHPRQLVFRLAGVVLGLGLLTAGCAAVELPPASNPVSPPTGAAASPTDATSTSALSASAPTRLRIPAIDVDSGLIALGLRADGTMEVPPDGRTAGWYTESPTPGERGPAVLAAHVDWNREKGVFYDLRELRPGDDVTVKRKDGIHATFRVSRVAQYPKDRFPTDEVYGDVEGSQLRLITCGGDFNPDARSYRDNIVVYADLMKSA